MLINLDIIKNFHLCRMNKWKFFESIWILIGIIIFSLNQVSLSALDEEKSQFLFNVTDTAQINFKSGNKDDFLFGGVNHDQIEGKDGKDKLYGGFGNDTFKWLCSNRCLF